MTIFLKRKLFRATGRTEEWPCDSLPVWTPHLSGSQIRGGGACGVRWWRTWLGLVSTVAAAPQNQVRVGGDVNDELQGIEMLAEGQRWACGAVSRWGLPRPWMAEGWWAGPEGRSCGHRGGGGGREDIRRGPAGGQRRMGSHAHPIMWPVAREEEDKWVPITDFERQEYVCHYRKQENLKPTKKAFFHRI
jgi:hypothetical protein